jgi:hypothetical protein
LPEVALGKQSEPRDVPRCDPSARQTLSARVMFGNPSRTRDSTQNPTSPFAVTALEIRFAKMRRGATGAERVLRAMRAKRCGIGAASRPPTRACVGSVMPCGEAPGGTPSQGVQHTANMQKCYLRHKLRTSARSCDRSCAMRHQLSVRPRFSSMGPTSGSLP